LFNRRRLSTLLVATTVPAAVFGPLLACGGDSPKVDSGIHVVDSQSIDAPVVCNATASYGTVNLGTMQVETNYAAGVLGSNAPHEQDMDGALNADTDLIHLWVYDGFGSFGTGSADKIKTGTYPLTGNETSFATCGICLFIDTDFVSGGMPKDTYFATGGSLNLTSVGSNGSGTFAGTLSNVTLAHVTINQTDGTTTAVGDCNSAITSLAFSGPLAVGSAAFNGKPDAGTFAHASLRHRFR
jgi:hypothetical protein